MHVHVYMCATVTLWWQTLVLAGTGSRETNMTRFLSSGNDGNCTDIDPPELPCHTTVCKDHDYNMQITVQDTHCSEQDVFDILTAYAAYYGIISELSLKDK